MTDDDPFTMDARLCDDAGDVSGAQHPGPFTGTYLDFLHHLRSLSAYGSGEKLPARVEESFQCTGHAHLAGEHIRCTSPAHQPRPWAQPIALPTTRLVFDPLANAHAALATYKASATRRAQLATCEQFLASKGGQLTAEELLAFVEGFHAWW